MAISPILYNGSVTRMQDVTQIKQNEDTKGMVDQTNFQNTFHKQIDHKLKQVHQSENEENRQRKFDAKDKGDNEYSGDGGKKRQQNKPADGKVIAKTLGGFDMKV